MSEPILAVRVHLLLGDLPKRVHEFRIHPFEIVARKKCILRQIISAAVIHDNVCEPCVQRRLGARPGWAKSTAQRIAIRGKGQITRSLRSHSLDHGKERCRTLACNLLEQR